MGKTLEEIRARFADDRFATENGAVVEDAGEHWARCSLPLSERHRNAFGGVMGGVHFMLADFAFAVATNQDKMNVVNVHSDISYLRAVQGNTLVAEAHCEREGGTLVFYRVELLDDKKTPVAIVNVTGFRKR